ncbi:MAG: ATP-dependent RNA helicase HrpA [Planctomycetota bacterium]|nr:ATP-dependent RNA helicase HrpA [Planctomycetota bacterium]
MLTHESINQAYRPDRFRLKRLLQRVQRLPEGSARRESDLGRLEDALKQSIERRTQREAIKLNLDFDPELPITAHRESLIDQIRSNQVLVVCGETGSGKSTQLPKLCLEAGYGRQGMIGHTQPRRLAARSIAMRLREEIATESVGFKIRFTDATQPATLVKLMTDGVLLSELSRDRFLDAYDCILIDEAHERSLNIDLLLAYLHQLLPKRPDLRLIITSATIDAEKFSNHFSSDQGPAPIVLVSGRTYPVDIRYMGATSMHDSEQAGAEDYYRDSAYNILDRFTGAVDQLLSEMRGDILSFFPSERDIREAHKHLRGHLTNSNRQQPIEIIPLYSRLTEAEQQRVFQPHRDRRIVLATNVAESSLTVPGIYSVIDTGTARISRYAARSKVQRLPIEPISQASANQRAGRCGRLAPGICIRLYDEGDFQARPPFTTPEIRRTDLASAILQTELLGIGPLEQMPLLDPPRPEMIRNGLATLHEIGAIDDESRITEIGRRIGRWPVSPRVGRMLLAADANGCLADVLIIASALECQDPRQRPPEKAGDADAAHEKFNDPRSDFVSYLRIWDFYHRLKEELGRGRLEKALKENYLSILRMREWADVHRQLVVLTQEVGLRSHGRKLIPMEIIPEPRNQNSRDRRPTEEATKAQVDPRTETHESGFDEVHLSLLTGLLSGIANLDDQKRYKAAGNMELTIWPGSGLKRTRAPWIMAAEIVETTARYARTCAQIDVDWIESIANHILKRHYESPFFSRKNGAAMIYERATLFGLPVVARRPRTLAPIDAEQARRLLIDVGLAEQQLVTRADFVQHNNKLLEEVQEWAAKTRRRDLVVDSFFLQQFYENVIPAEVVDRVTLEKWEKSFSRSPITKQPIANQPNAKGLDRNQSVEPKSLDKPPMYLTWEKIVDSLDRQSAAEQFPSSFQIGPTILPVTYRFEPGGDADGITIQVPSTALTQISEDRLGWIVPGMLKERVLGLIKSLPKSQRRNLVPAPDVAAKAVELLRPLEATGAPFWNSLCSVLSKLAGIPIRKSDFDPSRIDPHLAVRIEVLDADGKVKESTRSIEKLLPDRPAISNVALVVTPTQRGQAWHREKMTTFDIELLPESIVVEHSGLRIERYPAIVDKGGFAATTMFDEKHVAQHAMQVGLVRLFALVDNRELKSQVAYLPNLKDGQIWIADRMSSELLKSDLQDLIARVAFLEPFQSIRSKDDFELARIDRVRKISMASVEVAKWFTKFVQQYQAVRLAKQSAPAVWRSVTQSIDQQMESMFSPGFMIHTPWEWLKEFPRYLQGIVARLNRLKTVSVAQDEAANKSLAAFWDDYQNQLEVNSSLGYATLIEPFVIKSSAAKPTAAKPTEATGTMVRWPIGKMVEYRWMIEEYRVSLFAQQLGTRVSVSPKRLEKLRDAISQGLG